MHFPFHTTCDTQQIINLDIFRYGEFPELCGLLGKYVKTQDKILMV